MLGDAFAAAILGLKPRSGPAAAALISTFSGLADVAATEVWLGPEAPCSCLPEVQPASATTTARRRAEAGAAGRGRMGSEVGRMVLLAVRPVARSDGGDRRWVLAGRRRGVGYPCACLVGNLHRPRELGQARRGWPLAQDRQKH